MIQLCPISRGWRSGECWGRGEYMAQWWGVAVTLSFPPSSRWLTQDLCVYLSQCLSTCSFSLYVSTCLLVLSLSFSLSTFPSLSLLAALSACLLSLPVSRSLSHSTVSLSNCLCLSLYIFIFLSSLSTYLMHFFITSLFCSLPLVLFALICSNWVYFEAISQ